MLLRVLPMAVLGMAVACGDGADATPDADEDAGNGAADAQPNNGGQDAAGPGADSGGAAGNDAGGDASPDAPTDAGVDTGPSSYALSIEKSGNGTGTVTSAPTGIDCGATCTSPFAAGVSVTLTAQSSAGSTFTGWTGACSGSSTTCVVTMNAATAVTATFTLNPVLTVTKAGTGGGTVTSAPAGIACGATCSATGISTGTSVTLTAVPEASTIFAGWSGGGCTGTGPCTVALGADTAVTATFTKVVFTTWDPAYSPPGVTYTNGDLSVSGNSATTKNVRTLAGKSTGKWYWEITATAGDGATNAGGLGVMEHVTPSNAQWIGGAPSGLSFGYGACCSNQWWVNWAGVTAAGAPPAGSAVKSGNVYMFALDMDAKKLWIGLNGAWFNAGDPGTSANPVAQGLSGTVYPGITFYQSSINAFTANFGASAFANPVPAGFNPGVYSIPTTWDPAWSVAGITYTNGDLSISGNAPNTKNARTLVGRSLGKYYWEITATGGNGTTNAGGLGVMEAAMANNGGYIGQTPSGLSFGYGQAFSSQWWVNWAGVTTPSGNPTTATAVKAGIVYQFALDMSAGRIWIGQDGAWYNGGNPATGANPAAVGLTGTVYPGVTFYGSSINAFTANFGASAFKYGVPSGFGAGFY